MEKGKRIVLIIAAIIVVVIVGVILIMVMMNKEKISMTAIEFKSIMKSKNFETMDSTYQFAEYDYVKQVYLATEGNYKIEFYELQDEESAVFFFNNNVSIAENSKGSSASTTNISGSNYNRYTLSSNGKYKVISRINNTVIYLNVDDVHKESVKTLLKDLGY